MIEINNSNATKRVVLLNWLLLLPSLTSLAFGIRNAFRGSKDFQWSGARMFALRIDPYLDVLRGDPRHLDILTQGPEYLHELYIVIFPIGFLSYAAAKCVWICVGLALSGVSILLLGKIYELQRPHMILLALLLMLSTPFRVCLGNGQTSLVELLLIVLLLQPLHGRGIILGLSYFKASYSPVFFFYYLLRSRWRLVLASLVPPVVGLILFWLRVHGNIFKIAIEPFEVNATSGLMPGSGDLMTMILHFATFVPYDISAVVGAVLGFLGSILLGWLVATRKQTDAIAFPSLVVASLLLLRHIFYDYVLLLIPLAATLGTFPLKARSRDYGLAIIGLLWFVFPNLSKVFKHVSIGIPLACMFILLVAAFIYYLPVCKAEPV